MQRPTVPSLFFRHATFTAVVAPREQVIPALRRMCRYSGQVPVYFYGRTHPILDLFGGSAAPVDIWPVQDAGCLLDGLDGTERPNIVVEHDPAFYAPCPDLTRVLGLALQERVKERSATVAYVATRSDPYFEEIAGAADRAVTVERDWTAREDAGLAGGW
jgi:hypothetical protein